MNKIELRKGLYALYIDDIQITPYEWDGLYVNEKKNMVILITNNKVAVYDICDKKIIFEMSEVDQVQVHDNERIMVGKGYKDALYSIDGDVLLDFFEGFIFPMNNYYVLKSKEKYGIALLDGTVVVPIKYDDIAEEKSHIIVTLNNKKGVYNLKGELVLNTEYDRIGVFDNYIITVPDEGNVCRRQIYTLDGKKLICDRDDVFSISDDYAGILVETQSRGDGYSLYSFDGQIILKCYDYIEIGDNSSDGAIIARKNGEYGLFDLIGNELLPCEYKNIVFGGMNHYEAGIVSFWNSIGQRGVYSLKERRIVVPIKKYTSIESYKNGICELISEDNEHGYYITEADKFIATEDINITKTGKYEFLVNGEWKMLEI